MPNQRSDDAVRVQISMNATELEQIDKQAAELGMPRSRYLVWSALKRSPKQDRKRHREVERLREQLGELVAQVDALD